MAINGVLYQARTGLPWRDLPDRFGCWVMVYKRQRRWSADGTWQRLLTEVQAAQGHATISVDPGAVRVHDAGSLRWGDQEEGSVRAQPQDPVLTSLALRLSEVVRVAATRSIRSAKNVGVGDRRDGFAASDRYGRPVRSPRLER
jgi:hypothetical protein